jgi:hypothetical protein
MTRSIGFLGVLLVVACAGTIRLAAQEQTSRGSIVGFVRDTQGGVIPGATVRLVSETRGTRAEPVVTDAAGAYVFMRVAGDTYTVEAAMPGFQTARRTGVVVPGGAPQPVSVPMVLSTGQAPVGASGICQLVRESAAGSFGPADCSMRVIAGDPGIDRQMMKPAPVDRVFSLRTIPAPACPGASFSLQTPNRVFGPLTPLK